MSFMRKDATGWILMCMALALGAFAYVLVQQYLDQQAEHLREAAEASRGDMGQTVVASRVLKAGEIISEATMSIGRIPAKHIPSRAVRPQDFEQVRQRVLNRPMSPGEPLLADFVAGLVVNRFSELLPAGTRAVSVRVSALESHSGLLLPGDYIDLFAQIPLQRRHRQTRLVGLFERVKVLAAGQQPLRSADQAFQPLADRVRDYSYVTLALPASDAEDLLRARDLGDIVYLLRGPDDDASHFALSGIPMFADQDFREPTQIPARTAQEGGYTYYSSRVPRGEKRGQHRAGLAGDDDPHEWDAAALDAPELDEKTMLRLIHRPVLPATAQPYGKDDLRSIAHESN